MLTLTAANGTADPQPSFAILTANAAEKDTVFRFLGGDPGGSECETARGYTFQSDIYLKEKFNKKMEVNLDQCNGSRYYTFQLKVPGEAPNQITGAHFHCDHMGPWGAFDKTVELLKVAKSKKWPLRVIFLVGCCGLSTSTKKKEKKNWRGTILLTDQVKDYLHIGKAEADEEHIKCTPRHYDLGETWLEGLKGVRKSTGRGWFTDIPVERVGQVLSGPLVIKDQLFGDKYREAGVDIAGVEMEVVGVYKAVEAIHKYTGSPKPDIVLAKGASDYTGGKGEDATCMFFDRESRPMNDDELQECATFHSIGLVIRFVATNMKQLLQPQQ